MKTSTIIKNRIRCKCCGDVIESKSTHDFKYCSCGKCAVDGGLNYLKRSGEVDNYEELSLFEEKEIIPKYKIGDIVAFVHLGSESFGQIKDVRLEFNSYKPIYIIKAFQKENFVHILEKDIIRTINIGI